MRIGVDPRHGAAKRRRCGRVGQRSWCGTFATLLALLAGLVANPPLRAGRVVSISCNVGGRPVEVYGSSTATAGHHGDHPWQVAIFSGSGSFACGGVLLGAEWVLTTGLCVAGANPQSLAVGYGASDLGEAWTARRAVSEIHLHPEFDDPEGILNDIALLRLADPVENVRNSHANLPGEGKARALERPGTCAVGTGWGGWSRWPQTTPSGLKAGDLRIMSGKECGEAYGIDEISAGYICAGLPITGSLAMAGDIGGALTAGGAPLSPLWLVGERTRPRWLVGILSQSPATGNLQDANPSVYTRVSHYAGWIESTMARSRERQSAREHEWRSPLGMEFLWIPQGAFVMGSPEDEEGRNDDEVQHAVRISQGFWMGKYEVTQGEWEAVMGENPSDFKECGSRCPVDSVSWEDVQEFTQKLNERESGSGYRYRLPSEAEWEYAARAGTTGARYGELEEIAWYEANSGEEPHPVGMKRANAWGLHDMLGSVWEWTADWYETYPTGSVTDPEGPSTGSNRVARGGSWYYYAGYVRSADRRDDSPGYRHYNIGFRLVRTE